MSVINFNDHVYANESHYEFHINTGINSGTMSYSIGNYFNDGNTVSRFHFPISRLIFPINTVMLNAKSTWGFQGFHFSLGYSKSIRNLSGPALDYDWLKPTELNFYSESRADLNFSKVFIEISQSIYNAALYHLDFKFNIQENVLRYRLSDTLQTYPDENNRIDQFLGPTLDYTSRQKEIGVGLALMIDIQPVTVGVSGILYPAVTIIGYDHHILRAKHSYSHSVGNSFEFNADFSLMLTDNINWYFNGKAKYTFVKGRQRQETVLNNKVDLIGTIDHDVEVRYSDMVMGVKFLF